MTSPVRRLLVERDESFRELWDTKHVTLQVRPELARVLDSNGRPAIDGFDVNDADAWRDLAYDALDLAGMLARVAVDVLPDLVVGAMEHGCKWRPWAFSDDDGEIKRGHWGDCSLWTTELDDNVVEDGILPHLRLTVPRNRERAWLARLNESIEALTKGTADSLSFAN